MNKKQVLAELIKNLEKYLEKGYVFHPKFMQEFQALLKNATGNEKEIFALLVKQLDFLKELGTNVYKADSNEIIKYQDRDYYSLHLSGKNFNLRLLMAFDEKDTPKFLVAFYERAGKKKTDYTQYKKVLDSRFEEIQKRRIYSMEKKVKENSASLADLLAMFEDDISIADINASRYLGKISASIVKRRIELKMSQKEFAGYLGVSQGMISRWEGGDYNFSIKALSEIAEKLELELYINLKPPVKKSKECYIEQKTEYIFAKDDDKRYSKSNIIQFNSKRNHLDNKIKMMRNFELQEM